MNIYQEMEVSPVSLLINYALNLVNARFISMKLKKVVLRKNMVSPLKISDERLMLWRMKKILSGKMI